MWKQLDDNGSAMMVGDVLEVKGKGRGYLFKRSEGDALSKREEYLFKPNVEVSLDIKVDELESAATADNNFINIGGPTNHFADVDGNSNGRNYNLVFRLDRDGLGFKKETCHGTYDENHTKEEKMQLGRWYNIRYRQTVAKDNELKKDVVNLDGWVDDKSIGSMMDDGRMTEDTSDTAPIVANGDRGALYGKITDPKQIWTIGAYSGLYIRLTGTAKTSIKNLSIREF